jgi:GTP diphosphokinase / guanosine-3',5'-bis(diphosphate) 3'-diphosphatase
LRLGELSVPTPPLAHQQEFGCKMARASTSKGPAKEPYINHLLEVATLVADATGGTDTNLVIAALLHDAIEDCEVPRELIAEAFGDDVASIIQEVTDDKTLPKQVRKDEQVKTASKKSLRAKLLKLADKTRC